MEKKNVLKLVTSLIHELGTEMEKEEKLDFVMSLVREFGVENDAMRKLVPAPSEKPRNFTRPKKTSNGFEIYYDDKTGDSVGIIYKDRVFCKKTSSEEMNHLEAVEYCKTIYINGIQSELCPVDKVWPAEFDVVYEDLYRALLEIGAETLGEYTWCADSKDGRGWVQFFCNGSIFLTSKMRSYFVRPTLPLNK